MWAPLSGLRPVGINQPQGATSLVIATFNDDNERHERVLRLETIDDKHYIAANHWPRSWYRQALDNPNVEAKMPGTDSFEPHEAVNVVGDEDAYVRDIYSFGFNFASERLSSTLFPAPGTSTGLSGSNTFPTLFEAVVCLNPITLKT